MNLTDFVSLPHVNERIREFCPKPRVSWKELPEPCRTLTKTPPLMGTAFDYLLRARLRHHYPNAVTKRWVAEAALDVQRIRSAVRRRADYDRERLTEEQVMERTVLAGAQAELCLTAAKDRYAIFVRTGQLTDELLQDVIDLARIDSYYRPGVPDFTLGKYATEDIEDLKAIYERVPINEFTGKKRVWLNPTFEAASAMVGGADADLIIDDTLIDIKTWATASLDSKSWGQLVGYCVLIDIARDMDLDLPRIGHVGIYWSRHGVLQTWPLTDFYRVPNFSEFKSWFAKEAEAAVARDRSTRQPW